MRRRGSRLVKKYGDSIIYDTSSFYSNNKKFTVKRDTDLVIADFTPDEVVNEAYLNWLNTANGILLNMNSDGLQYPTTTVSGNSYLLTNGRIAFSNSNLTAPFGREFTYFSLAITCSDSSSVSNQKYNFGVYAINSGAMIRVVYDSSNTSRRKQIHFAWKTENGVIFRKYFTATNYEDAIENVIVFSVTNDIPVFIVNGVTYNSFADTDVNFGWFEGGTSKIVLGNRIFPSSLGFKSRHFSIDFSRTPQEISNELMNIYQ